FHHILIYNQMGKSEIIRWFKRFYEETQQREVRLSFLIYIKKDDNIANMLTGNKEIGNSEFALSMRHHAQLIFVFLVEKSRSELNLRRKIKVFLQVISKIFKKISQAERIRQMDRVEQVLRKVVEGTLLLDTDINELLGRLRQENHLNPGGGGFSELRGRVLSALKELNLPSIVNNINLGDRNVFIPNSDKFV
uniref:AP complex mu/sigma subunit domain-containing protein n=1 Tax=Pongo abelii TaxID=9601 RepID=A0A8I5YLJ9_PONAB